MDTENPPQVLPNGYVYSTKVHIMPELSAIQFNYSGVKMQFIILFFSFPFSMFWQALEEMAKKNDGKITCPRTGFVCNYKELVKAYISQDDTLHVNVRLAHGSIIVGVLCALYRNFYDLNTTDTNLNTPIIMFFIFLEGYVIYNWCMGKYMYTLTFL